MLDGRVDHLFLKQREGFPFILTAVLTTQLLHLGMKHGIVNLVHRRSSLRFLQGGDMDVVIYALAGHILQVSLIEDGLAVVACQEGNVLRQEGLALLALTFQIRLIGNLVGREAW